MICLFGGCTQPSPVTGIVRVRGDMVIDFLQNEETIARKHNNLCIKTEHGPNKNISARKVSHLLWFHVGFSSSYFIGRSGTKAWRMEYVAKKI